MNKLVSFWAAWSFLVLLLIAGNFPETSAGIPFANCRDVCIANPLLLPPLICLQSALFPCNYDVQVFHGASTGVCDDSNFNCLCQYQNPNGDNPPLNAYTGLLGPLINNCTTNNYTLCQCQANLTTEISQAYSDFCNFDCRCDHGAHSGSCNFDKRQCICHYNSTAWNEATDCPELNAFTGLNVTGYTDTFLNLLYSFCNYTLPMLNYSAAYCLPTGP